MSKKRIEQKRKEYEQMVRNEGWDKPDCLSILRGIVYSNTWATVGFFDIDVVCRFCSQKASTAPEIAHSEVCLIGQALEVMEEEE